MHLDYDTVGNLHCRDVHQDSGYGIHSPRELLPPEHVEYHGFCCCGLGVRTAVSNININILTKSSPNNNNVSQSMYQVNH